MVKALACRVEGPGKSFGKKFQLKKILKKVSEKEKKKKKKKSFRKKGQLSSACMMEVRMTGVLPNL